jgi:hypothetical protein
MKTCSVCGKSKEVAGFYRHPHTTDGYQALCKECQKARSRRRTREKPSEIRAHRKTYRATPRGRALHRDDSRRYYRADKQRAKAHYSVSNAVRLNLLGREPCEICGREAEAHHDDYSKPLQVRWLCQKHHLEAHGRLVHGEF